MNFGRGDVSRETWGYLKGRSASEVRAGKPARESTSRQRILG